MSYNFTHITPAYSLKKSPRILYNQTYTYIIIIIITYNCLNIFFNSLYHPTAGQRPPLHISKHPGLSQTPTTPGHEIVPPPFTRPTPSSSPICWMPRSYSIGPSQYSVFLLRNKNIKDFCKNSCTLSDRVGIARS